MRLTAIGIRNFRSIGAHPVLVDLERKVNVLIGPNNSGKSNVIRALSWLREHGVADGVSLAQLDQHRQSATHPLGVVVKARVDENDHLGLSKDANITFELELTDNRFACIQNPFDQIDWPDFSEALSHYKHVQFRGLPGEETVRKEKADVGKLAAVDIIRAQLPKIRLVPQFRQIREGDRNLDGAGIVKLLASWQRPGPGNQDDIRRFVKVQDLLRRLLRMPKVELDVDYTNTTIMVTHDDLRLPLESYGTGIHELIILAIAVCAEDDAMYCIEEPEIHLHPRLQKEFLRFLVEETDKRYILTTHSPALLSMSNDVRVTRLWLQNAVTMAQPVDAPEHALSALDNLGVRASDILQANSVIWVEGPSDRIYLNRWLQLLEPGLREGIEYCVMFYGGRLLSHLSMARSGEGDPTFPCPDDLIPLLRLNQHSAIVMDSDRKKPGARLNESKLRVKRECEAAGTVCWVTYGREIENYLPAKSLAEAYTEKAGIAPAKLELGRHDSLEECLKKSYRGKWKQKSYYDRSKPEMAREIVKHMAEGDIGPELRKDLKPVIEAIKAANA